MVIEQRAPPFNNAMTRVLSRLRIADNSAFRSMAGSAGVSSVSAAYAVGQGKNKSAEMLTKTKVAAVAKRGRLRSVGKDVIESGILRDCAPTRVDALLHTGADAIPSTADKHLWTVRIPARIGQIELTTAFRRLVFLRHGHVICWTQSLLLMLR